MMNVSGNDPIQMVEIATRDSHTGWSLILCLDVSD